MHHVDILHAIERTSLVELRNCSPRPGVRFFAKLKGQSATGSEEDRIARQMVLGPERDGRLHPGEEVVEGSLPRRQRFVERYDVYVRDQSLLFSGYQPCSLNVSRSQITLAH